MNDIICIVCPKGCHLRVSDDGATVEGYGCERGIAYGRKEMTDPRRVVTSTVAITGASHPRLPVKTNGDIPKAEVARAVRLLDDIVVVHPVASGDVIVADILGTGVDFVATRSM